MGEREDEATYGDLVDQLQGGSAESEASRSGRLVDEGASPSPPEVAVAVDRPGVTAEGQREGAPLSERLREEEPDRPTGAPTDDGVGLLQEPGVADLDEEGQMVATLEPVDAELSEEERAVHVEGSAVPRLGGTDDPDDGYVDD